MSTNARRISSLTIMAMTVLVLSAIPAFAEAWNPGTWQAELGAFDMAFNVLNDGNAVQDANGNDWYYYQWDLTLLTKTDNPVTYFKCNTGSGPYLYDMTLVRGFAFLAPAEAHIVNGGSFIEQNPGVLSPLNWQFKPGSIDKNWQYGEWTGNEGNSQTIPAGTPGHFKAGLWSNSQFEPDAEYEVRIHVGTLQGYTGFVGSKTSLTTSDDPGGGGGPPPPITPELPPGALLLLGLVPVGIARLRRRK